MEASDRPKLVPVARGADLGRLTLAVVVAGVLIAAAVWKPWAGPAVATRSMADTVHVSTDSTSPLASAPGAVSTIGSVGPLGATIPNRPTRIVGPVFAGLDLSVMGTADPHATWGVAVAYVSRTEFADALVRGAPTVTPVVGWELIGLNRAWPGPALDDPGDTTVAIAATWPAEVQPVAVRLVSLGSGGSGLPRKTETGPTVRPSTAVIIPLGDPISPNLRVFPGRSVAASPRPGAFFLPGPTPPTMAGWPGHGWPPATYAFEVEIEGGRWTMLPFTIGAAIGPG